MSTYRVSFHTGAFTSMEVEADSPEDAREIADSEFSPPQVCAQCSGWGMSKGDLPIEVGDDWEQDESETGVWEVEA